MGGMWVEGGLSIVGASTISSLNTCSVDKRDEVVKEGQDAVDYCSNLIF